MLYLPKTGYRGAMIQWPKQDFAMDGEPMDFTGYSSSILQVLDASGNVVATGTVVFSENEDGDLDTASSYVPESASTALVEGTAYTYRELAISGTRKHVLRHGPLYIAGAATA